MINVLSLFDGMSCGQIALERSGIQVGTYYASEIDKHAITVTKKNYPCTVHLGDVTRWREWDIDWSSIGLVMGGSPCQGFSFAGSQLAFDDPRSVLFFVFVDILNHIKSVNPDVKFLLENVRMKREFLDVITEHLGVEPVFINSALVSAQNRRRYYWANWDIMIPTDRGVTWGDVREYGVNEQYYSNGGMCWIDGHGCRKNKRLRVYSDTEKMQMLEASHYKKYSSQRFFGILDTPADVNINQRVMPSLIFDQYDDKFYRYITPVECERLQTVPDNYTHGVSNTQRYKMLGNGWSVDTIVHVFLHAPLSRFMPGLTPVIMMPGMSQ